MLFAAYWPCSDGEAPVWSALRLAAEAFGDNVAEPFGTVRGCPPEFPQTLMAGVLFGKTAVVLVSAVALAHIFRDTLDGFKARRARQVIVFSGLSDETLDVLRSIASGVTDQQTILVVDPGPGLPRAKEVVRDIRREFARSHKRSKAIALPLDSADSQAVETFMKSRGKRGIQGLYLMSGDTVSNLQALKIFLPEGVTAKPRVATEVPGRVVVRVDNPWHAEDWRRQQMVGNPGWLFDAVSVLEMAARHVLSKLKETSTDRIIISEMTSFTLAVLDELAFEHRLDGLLSQVSAAAKAKSKQPDSFVEYRAWAPEVVLVGKDARRIAENLRDQLRRFGIDPGQMIVGVHDSENPEEAMARLLQEGRTPALIADNDSEHDVAFLAVRHPNWTIFEWNKSVGGIADAPLLGALWLVGPTLKPTPDFGLDIWDRLGAVQHWTYVLNFLEGRVTDNDPNRKRGLWTSLSPFAKESNIRTFYSFMRSVANLPHNPRRLGTDLRLGGTETEAPLEGDEVFLELGEREHESWYKHHTEYGFKWGPERKGKRHPDLRNWSDLGPY
jgi:hypothetical protein